MFKKNRQNFATVPIFAEICLSIDHREKAGLEKRNWTKKRLGNATGYNLPVQLLSEFHRIIFRKCRQMPKYAENREQL